MGKWRKQNCQKTDIQPLKVFKKLSLKLTEKVSYKQIELCMDGQHIQIKHLFSADLNMAQNQNDRFGGYTNILLSTSRSKI